VRFTPRTGASRLAVRTAARHPGARVVRGSLRRHLALLTAVALVSAFGYLLLHPRTVRIQADGQDLTVRTKLASETALLDRAGVALGDGDRVTALRGDGADVLRVERARDVVLRADGRTRVLRTHAVTVGQLLDEAGVVVTGRDSVLQDGGLVPPTTVLDAQPRYVSRSARPAQRPEGVPLTVEVRRAVSFTIAEDGREVRSTSSRTTVAQALREAGVVIGPGDIVTPLLQSRLEPDMRVGVRHATMIVVSLLGHDKLVYTHARTVGEALTAAGIRVPDGAYIDPPAETAIVAGMSVALTQVVAADDVQYKTVFAGTVYEPDEDMLSGETRVVEGSDGVLVRRYVITYVNGEEAGRELVEEYYDPEPVDTVIYYGVAPEDEPTAFVTAPEPADTATPAGEFAGARTLNVWATWYNPASAGRPPGDPDYGRTATGVMVTYGIVAVDPNVIPLGTRMYIPGYGYGIAADTGGAIKGYTIDLGFPDGVEVDWATQWVDIYILD